MAKTLLAVEDSKTMRKVLGITFASDEFETILVDNAQEGLAKLEQVRPDVALVDVTLSDVNGYDLCRRFKARAPGVPVMILSSRQQPYDPVRGAEAGADDFIDKPFDTQQMRDKVAKLCAKNGAAARPAAAAAAAPPAAAPRAPAPPAAPRAPAAAPPPQAPPARPRAAEPARSVSASLRAVTGAGGASEAANGALLERLQGLELTEDQVTAVLAISREVIEKVVWEVVPVLAETLIKEEIARLTRE